MVAAGIGLLIGELVLGFLSFVIPILGLASLCIHIYLGTIGYKLAWQNRRFDSVQHCKLVEGIWAKWVLGFVLVTVAFLGLLFMLGLVGVVQNLNAGNMPR